MKIFILVVILAAVIGGFIGGEITDQTFTIWGAALGGVGTFGVLMGLGAFFSRQDEKRKGPELTPEMRAVFGRMAERQRQGSRENPAPREPLPSTGHKSIDAAILGLIEQDMMEIKAGGVPERRLIPHHRFKRDAILKAYANDFSALSLSMQKANHSDYDSKITAIKRLDVEELDKVIAIMKETRSDLQELEQEVRAQHNWYASLPPLFD